MSEQTEVQRIEEAVNTYIHIGVPLTNEELEAIQVLRDLARSHLSALKGGGVPSAKQLHEWYLEATMAMQPGEYNPKAQKPFEELTIEQQSIDKYIAEKMLALIVERDEKIKALEAQLKGQI